MEQELSVARETAESANKAKSVFLANMSHEIRSPLNSIVGFSQILINQSVELKLPDTFRQYLGNINSGGQNLSEIINDILDLSKIEAGKMVMNEDDFNVKQVVKSIFHLNRNQALEKGVALNYDIDQNIPDAIRSDRTEIQKILMNLVSNAIKFTPEKHEVMLSVTMDQTRSNLIFTVRDTGIGISKERLSAIFEPFEQADSTISQHFGGTGLGLTITKKLVELLHGDIQVESELGKGSVFKVKIPLVQPDFNLKKVDEFSFSQYKFSRENKVLAVEDDKMSQEMLKALFEELGLDVTIAENGKQAVELAASMKPDLILMDLHLPILSGVEAVRLIRAAPEGADVPIVVLSADAFKEQIEKAAETEINDFLTKPIEFQKAMPILSKYLKPKE